MEGKDSLRRIMAKQRRAINPEKLLALGAIITEKLLKSAVFNQAQTYFCYLSIGNEIDTWQLIEKLWQKQKTVLVPKLVTDQIVPVKIDNFDHLIKNRGIWEPEELIPYEMPIDIAVIPGLAFTANGHRLGRGAGHYDRFLSSRSSILKIALAFDWQILDTLPIDIHDQEMDLIITEKRIIKPH